MRKKKQRSQNTGNIKKKFENLQITNINPYVKGNLHNYLSHALRISFYYGNLWIKYVGFNFTFLAFLASFVSIYTTIILQFKPSQWLCITWPILIGAALYTGVFFFFLSFKHNTVSFEHEGLQHYSWMMKKEDYEDISEPRLEAFLNHIGNKNNIEYIKRDLEALIMQYVHQANYNRMSLRLRKCLIWGEICLIGCIITSLVFLYINILP